MAKSIYSIRTGKNQNLQGFPLDDFKDLFYRIYKQFEKNSYFDEHLNRRHTDDIELDVLLKTRKRNLWPIENNIESYSEDDIFDIIEFLYLNVSKPVEGAEGPYDSWHWETFSRTEGQSEYTEKINEALRLYEKPFEISAEGEILIQVEQGFDQIFKADIPSTDDDIKSKLESAIKSYRKYRSTLNERKQAVRDLVDVLEYLRPKVKSLLTKKDENDLFNIANNFGIRHHNEKQKTDYDTSLWLSWMFYFYLSTIHVVLRKIQKQET